MDRREFGRAVTRLAAGVVGVPLVGACYGFAGATNLAITRPTVAVPNLPSRFHGLTVALLTDLHHGPYASADYIAGVVRTTASLNADVIVLGGDYSLRDAKFIAPCCELLAALDAPLGVYAVLGNHDHAHGLDATRAGLKRAKIIELTNRNAWLARGPDRLSLAGVDDLWYGTPDLKKALHGVGPQDACVLLSHNPDFAETVADPRIGLVLSGHTHGGQIVAPGYGAPFVPSRYGQKYAQGLVEAPRTQVYISAGTGMSILPVRMNCRPEIAVVTLAAAG